MSEKLEVKSQLKPGDYRWFWSLGSLIAGNLFWTGYSKIIISAQEEILLRCQQPPFKNQRSSRRNYQKYAVHNGGDTCRQMETAGAESSLIRSKQMLLIISCIICWSSGKYYRHRMNSWLRVREMTSETAKNILEMRGFSGKTFVCQDSRSAKNVVGFSVITQCWFSVLWLSLQVKKEIAHSYL